MILGGDCNFEQASPLFCGWKNLKTDKADWKLGAGQSVAAGAGPSTDHTHGDKTGNYTFESL